MKAQLADILELSERPNIGIRVVPKSVRHHPGSDGAFMLITMRNPHTEVSIHGVSAVALRQHPGGLGCLKFWFGLSMLAVRT